MSYNLSEGSIMTIMTGGDYTNPVLQVLSLKKINGISGQERYRVFLSDGRHTISFAMMTAPVYAQAGENGLNKNSIIKVKRYLTSVINNTGAKGDSRVLLLLEIELLVNGDLVGERIGNPTPFSDSLPAPESKNNSFESSGPPSKVPKLSTSNGSTMIGNGTSNFSTDGASASFSSGLANRIIHPISSLSPYQNKWIIKARVTNKTPIRTWSNSRSEGKLFNMDLLDDSGEIRLTAFRDMVDKYFEKIEVDKVYYISKCIVKIANKNFNSLNNDYEMTMTEDTIIEECEDDNDSINPPQIKYNFISLDKIADLEANSVVDIVGVVRQTFDLQKFQSKQNREVIKREILIMDQSKTSVILTLWGADAETFEDTGNPVVAAKGVRLSEYNGAKFLSVTFGSTIRVNPELPEAYKLKGWYESEGHQIEAHSISVRTGGNSNTPWMSFKEVLENNSGTNNAVGDYYQLKGTVLLFKAENACYKACPEADCNKKVIDISNGMYRCEKCNKEYTSFKWRLIANMNVGDPTGNQWMSMFTSEAEKVIGMSAQEAGDLFENDNSRFKEVLEAAHFKQFILKCRVKMERYNDEQRLKTVVIKVDDINHAEYNAHLIKSCKELLQLS